MYFLKSFKLQRQLFSPLIHCLTIEIEIVVKMIFESLDVLGRLVAGSFS